MDDRDIERVERSFAMVAPIRTMAAEMFYARLFTIAPEVEPMFKGDMAAQRDKLMDTLALVVNGLRDLDDILPAARDLAARHVTYGVTPRHYEPVGEALIWTLGKALEDEFTPEVEAAWARAYGVFSDAMVAAAYPRAAAFSSMAAE